MTPEPTPTPTDPAVPTSPVELTDASMCLGTDGKTYVSLTVLGAPGAQIQALLNGSSAGADDATLGADGTETISLRPNLEQIAGDADVEIHYVTMGGPIHPYSTTLGDLGVNLISVIFAPSCG